LIYSSKPPTPHGHGQKIVNTFDGLPMVKDDQLWKMASVYLKLSEVTREYGHRKV
jgi:hypothetical protein